MEPNHQDAYEDDLKRTRHTQAYAHHFEQCLEEETILESVMMDCFSELYEHVFDLKKYHKTMLELHRKGHKGLVFDKWIEHIEIEATKRTEG